MSCGCGKCKGDCGCTSLQLPSVNGQNGTSVIIYNAQTSDPTTPPGNGNGGIWFNTITQHVWVFPTGGSAWVDAGSYAGTNGSDGSSVEADFAVADPVSPTDDPASGNSGIWFNSNTGHIWFFPVGGPWADQGDYVGDDGVDGINAFTFVAVAFIQPSSGATVDVTVDAGTVDWIGIGQRIYVENGGEYLATASDTGTDVVTLQNTGDPVNAAPGATIPLTSKISPSGRKGATGAAGTNGSAGAAGHTPVFFSGTGIPSVGLGVDGDLYGRQINERYFAFGNKVSGAWQFLLSAFIRVPGFINVWTADPNTLSLGVNFNPGDFGFTVIGTNFALWQWNGAAWIVTALQWSSGGGGGGGSDTLTSAAAASTTVGGTGQAMGPQNWAQERAMGWVSRPMTNATPGATVNIDFRYKYTDISITADTVLNNTGYTSQQSEWYVRIINGSGSTREITWSAGIWGKMPDVPMTNPFYLAPSEFLTMRFLREGDRAFLDRVYTNIAIL